MNRKFLILVSGLIFSLSMYAQETYIGVGLGTRSSTLNYNNLDKDYFPKSGSELGPLFSAFAQIEFGADQNLAIRPQISFVNRGGKMSGPSDDIEIIRRYFSNNVLIDQRTVGKQEYSLKPNFFDIRIPLVYQFMHKDSKLRPYVFAAPVLGITTGGKINMKTDFTDKMNPESEETKVSQSNMTNCNFAALFGVGAKCAINLSGSTCYVGLEVGYELGLTDTYSKGEKIEGTKSSSKPIDVYNNSKNYDIYGTRKMNGLEVQATLSLPLSMFKKKAQPVSIRHDESVDLVPVVKPVKKVKVEKEKPCYTVEEIQQMINEKKSVRGKVICAINDVIQFDFSKSTIKKESYSYLNSLAKLLINVNAKVRVCGHTDNIGSENLNKNLSQKRAEAVMNYLVKKGVNKTLLTAEGFGMEYPRATNDTEEGRAMNRRVEFEIEE